MKVAKATSRGQITLPKEWRSQFATDHYVLQENDEGLIVIPMGKRQTDDGQHDEIIFNADRDHDGIGLDPQVLINAMEKIAAEKA